MMTCSPSKSNRVMYVYDLPYLERKALCRILDLNDAWDELGGAYLGFDVSTLYHFKQAVLRNGSPTDELLQSWGIQNHTVLELFIQLSKMHHYQAMNVLKSFVPSNYHRLIHEGELNLCKLPSIENSDENIGKASGHDPGGKLLEFGAHNIDKGKNSAGEASAAGDKKILNTSVNGSEKTELNFDKLNPLKVAEGHTPMISYQELEEATSGWNVKNVLGKGGFGTVYKGTWKCTDVAIKKLEVQQCKGSDEKLKDQNQLFTELRSLNTFRHDNILPLYGFSVGGTHDCLVYQYMPNGPLDDKLMHGYKVRDRTRPLSWCERHNIAIGVARGLQFLHNFGDKPLVHGDIKSANILLDPSLVPKIGDFGLAREGPLENYTYIKVSRVHGTKPYLPNEFLRDRKFSTKVDVYSFGVVLFELASGLRAYDDKRKYKFLKDHVESVSDDQITVLCDPKIELDETISFLALITLGKFCTAMKPKNRPEMVYVLKELEAMLCTGEVNRRIPYIQINGPGLSTPSDLPLTRDRQITASMQPQLFKSISPVPHPPITDNQPKPRQPSNYDSSSSDFTISKLSISLSNAGPTDNQAINEAIIPQASEQQPASDSSAIPALSILLNRDVL